MITAERQTTTTISYDQLGLWGDVAPVKERLPRHLRLFAAAKLRIRGQKVAVVSNPRHPLYQQKVWIVRAKGESVEVLSALGRQVLVSPELRPVLPDEEVRAERETLRYALSVVVSQRDQEKIVDEIRQLIGMMH